LPIEFSLALKITNREVDGVNVVSLEGRIVRGEESDALREQVKHLLAAGERKIVLNMALTNFIDSAGLGTMVTAHHSARSQDGKLKLCNVGKRFQEILEVTALATVFEVYDSEAAAIGSFSE
jgi:anti-sigma B factor antagonist